MKKLILLLLPLGLFSCASMNPEYSALPYDKTIHVAMALGKTPQEVVKKAGRPLSAGWRNKDIGGKQEYYLVYPISNDSKIKYTDLIISGDRMECAYFLFFRDKEYKFIEEPGNSGNVYRDSCAKIKDRGEFWLDESFIADSLPKEVKK
jgi:hypothetical protein